MKRPGLSPPAPRRPEGIRWLRSDGKPNFSDRIYRKPGDAKLLARRPAYTVTRSSTVLYALEEMSRHMVRAMPVVHPSREVLEGVVSAMDMVNYLGGGELFNIVVKRHGGDLFSALLREYVSSIMNPNPVYAYVDEDLKSMLEKMVVNNVGFLPIVERDGRLWGVITEHDIVRHLVEKKVGVTVSKVMTRNVIYVKSDAVLHDAAKAMVRYGVRRLPILEETGEVWGLVTAKDVVKFFGSHEAFKFAESGKVDDVLSVPVKVVGTPGHYSIHPDADVGEAATRMMEHGVSSLMVVEEGRVVGIITERDILFAVAAKHE